MKTGVALSSVAHAAILGFAMVSIGAPKPLPTPDVEALPIELVSISEITRNVQGDRNATAEEPPAPAPTQRQVSVPAARTVGDQAKDTDVQAEKESPAPPVEKTEAPTPTPAPEPVERPETPKAEPEPTPPEPALPEPEKAEPTTEPEPERDIAMLLKENQQQAEPSETQADPDVLKLPDVVAAPKARPTRPAPEAEAKPAKKTEATEKATVNKAETTGGGAKASTQKKAGLGTKRGSRNGQISQSILDGIRERLTGCWNVAALTGHQDAATITATVDLKLNRDGTVDGRPRPKVTGTSDRGANVQFVISTRNAIEQCQPYKFPAESYDQWQNFTIEFNLSDML